MSGFPHSEISGSKVICTSPKLIAACRVLHRRQMPRHPPCALVYFQLHLQSFRKSERTKVLLPPDSNIRSRFQNQPCSVFIQNCKNFLHRRQRLATHAFRQNQSWLQRCLYLTRNMVRLRKSRNARGGGFVIALDSSQEGGTGKREQEEGRRGCLFRKAASDRRAPSCVKRAG